MDWQDIDSGPRDGTLVNLRYRFNKQDPWIETTGWFEEAPNDQCWYYEDIDGEDEAVDFDFMAVEWKPILL